MIHKSVNILHQVNMFFLDLVEKYLPNFQLPLKRLEALVTGHVYVLRTIILNLRVLPRVTRFTQRLNITDIVRSTHRQRNDMIDSELSLVMTTRADSTKEGNQILPL